MASCGGAVAADGAIAAIAVELGSVAGAPLSIPTAAAAAAAVIGSSRPAWPYANCMEAAGKPDEAARMRQQMEQLLLEVDELEQRLNAAH